jgi:2-polyprenyl-3-methyl-5-hydroxy-6-metoxy-1,4-benzoquinol methylase
MRRDMAGKRGEDRARALAERLFRARVGAFDVYAVYLGSELGLYRALADGEWRTPAEAARLVRANERYVREWLEHQAVTGIMEVEEPLADAGSRRFRLPPEHAEVLAWEDSTLYEAETMVEVGRVARQLPALVESFRTGDALDPLPRQPDGRGDYNRAIFLNLLGREWLPSIPAVHQRLTAEPPARMADVACGTGWSSIAMARAYPGIRVEGFDLDEVVIAAARRNAEANGVTDRVRFSIADAATVSDLGPFDLATVFEALHDMSRPVEVLSAIREALAPGGMVLVADERVAERFAAPGDAQERYVYGWSVVGCLGGAMGDPGTAATGAVMRPDTLRRYAGEAGFGRVEMPPVDNESFHFYLLMP